MKQRAITALNALGVFAALLALWQLILWLFRVPPYMLPSPWAVAKAVGARFPSLLNSKRSHPLTSILLPETVVPVSNHSDTPRSPDLDTKWRSSP
jgi:ABC-type nitrate/sulfonate/bicarbonate transport system permease component